MNNSAIVFDTLRYANKLKAAGVPEKQAEIQAETLAEIIDENLATKHDIELIRRDIKELELKLEAKINSLETKLLIKLGGLMLGVIALLQYLK
jgi:hypothetical protein